MATPVLSTLTPEAPMARARPAGVTYACVLSIVLGTLGALGGLFVLAFSSLFTLMPVVGTIFAAAGAFLGLIIIGVGLLGIVAGVQGMQGVDWARWAMVVLFGLGALTALTTIVVPVLNAVAIYMLLNAEGAAWFER